MPAAAAARYTPHSGALTAFGRACVVSKGGEVQDPIELFRQWYDQACRLDNDKPHAMVLCTAGSDGRPDGRMVLLSSCDERGLVFHTNYESRKGRQLAENPHASLIFWWDPLGYQVRIHGTVERTSAQESDAYWSGRPLGHQLAAWASQQSRPVEDRGVLDSRMAELEAEYEGREVPRPPHWGGYRLVPEEMEFWEHRDNRLHDRVRFRRTDQGWAVDRLAP